MTTTGQSLNTEEHATSIKNNIRDLKWELTLFSFKHTFADIYFYHLDRNRRKEDKTGNIARNLFT